MPEIKPQKVPEYEIKQSPTDIMPRLPLRALACGPGNSGKRSCCPPSFWTKTNSAAVGLGFTYGLLVLTSMTLGVQ